MTPQTTAAPNCPVCLQLLGFATYLLTRCFPYQALLNQTVRFGKFSFSPASDNCLQYEKKESTFKKVRFEGRSGKMQCDHFTNSLKKLEKGRFVQGPSCALIPLIIYSNFHVMLLFAFCTKMLLTLMEGFWHKRTFLKQHKNLSLLAIFVIHYVQRCNYDHPAFPRYSQCN